MHDASEVCVRRVRIKNTWKNSKLVVFMQINVKTYIKQVERKKKMKKVNGDENGRGLMTMMTRGEREMV